MSSFASTCLQTLEDTSLGNATRIWNTLTCSYSSAFGFSTMPSIGGISIFYMIMGLMALLGIQLRTKSFAFTGLVLLVCGGSLIAYFPEQWIRIGFTLTMMAFASLLLKICQDKV